MTDEKRLTGESKIAVLSVLEKCGSILKHIFLNLPLPPVPTSAAGGNASPRGRFLPGGREEKINEGDDEGRSILFGRHPNCHAVLDRPSISRFHLDRRSPRSLEAEVNGTWISGARILPNVTVDMVDGFTGFSGSLRAGRWRTRWNLSQKTKKKLLIREHGASKSVEEGVRC